MEPELFQRIKRAFERHGGMIIQDEDAQRYLRDIINRLRNLRRRLGELPGEPED